MRLLLCKVLRKKYLSRQVVHDRKKIPYQKKKLQKKYTTKDSFLTSMKSNVKLTQKQPLCTTKSENR